MFCGNCGKKNEEGVKFCGSCGMPINNSNSVNSFNTIQVSSVNNNQGYSMNQNTVPVYNNGYVNYNQYPMNNNKSNTGLIVAIIVIVVAIAAVIGFSIFKFLILYTPELPVSGDWKCKNFDGSGPNGENIVSFYMDDDYNFTWAKYGDEARNYVKGTYTYEYLDKSNAPEGYKYYTIKITGDEYVDSGVIQTESYNSQYEMGILTGERGSRQAVMINPYTYRMYYCYEN